MINTFILPQFYRKRSPNIDLTSLDQPCESIQPTDYECEQVEQLSEMEVDDITISNDDELKSDKDDLYPIASDPYVESIEPKHYHEGTNKHTKANTDLVLLLSADFYYF